MKTILIILFIFVCTSAITRGQIPETRTVNIYNLTVCNTELLSIIDSQYIVAKECAPSKNISYGCVMLQKGVPRTELLIKYFDDNTILENTKIFGCFKRNGCLIFVVILGTEPNDIGELFKRSTKHSKSKIKISQQFDCIGGILWYWYDDKKFIPFPSGDLR